MAADRSSPHSFRPKGRRFWLCRHCYWPRSAHPIHFWSLSRSMNNNQRASLEDAAAQEFAAEGGDPGD